MESFSEKNLSAWSNILTQRRSCTSMCYYDLHVDDILIIYQNNPIVSLESKGAVSVIQTALCEDLNERPKIVDCISVKKGDEYLKIVQEKLRRWKNENHVFGIKVRVQWLRVWYYRENH